MRFPTLFFSIPSVSYEIIKPSCEDKCNNSVREVQYKNEILVSHNCGLNSRSSRERDLWKFFQYVCFSHLYQVSTSSALLFLSQGSLIFRSLHSYLQLYSWKHNFSYRQVEILFLESLYSLISSPSLPVLSWNP